MTGLHRLLNRLVCHATTHDPSWAAGLAHGYDRPICSTCHRVLTVPEAQGRVPARLRPAPMTPPCGMIRTVDDRTLLRQDRALLRHVRDTLAQLETALLNSTTPGTAPVPLGDRGVPSTPRRHGLTTSYRGQPLVRDQVVAIMRDHPHRSWRPQDIERSLHRPKATLSHALGSLAADGVVRRTADGTWQLTDVPEQAAA